MSNLYIGPLDFNPAGQSISMVDLANPDFTRYPKFKDALASAKTAELAAGDAIYIPSLWWHAVQSLAPVNMLVNFWWRELAERNAVPFASMLHGILAIGRLPQREKEAWKALYEHYVFGGKDPMPHLEEAHKLALGARNQDLVRGMKAYIAESM
ncbi:cupin-like domain-containing protein [Bowmanella sp. Y26]|nr:cupin-like domain-containing protein [Bowmanella yangjiangensis]